ncbi:DNA-processing protein DprA [Sphingobium sufflavum]|uniref:DNA-processing protein DprA n=1 Tax=Sphingobium sufflavum TaxID=1129547 RepID=UPI001F31D499|nr:DNA-processing protein DprA [Sphingobium sufflavum]MCE7797540.1 DNA-processing protein DprA [Sphingobium sufflavum]
MNSDGQDRFDRLRLIRSPNVGPVAFRQLIARFGSAGSALRAIPDMAARGGARAFRVADERAVWAEIKAVEGLGGRHIFIGEQGYPALLAEATAAPPVLMAMGTLDLAERPVVAMVGARNASAAACRFARMLGQDVGARGGVVVSGLARGIDTAAHMGSLGSGTVAVIACGLDVVFPPENAALQERIAAEGLLLTEHPPGTDPLARHFPARNRIIAWMAQGTVVVEAAPRSGSLLTARLAGEEGREVMAVPGFPLDPRAQGCNALIREGATLVQSADDILESVGRIGEGRVRQPGLPYAAPPPADLAEGERQRVVGLLSMAPVAVDELIRQSGCAPGAVQTVLLELEIAGRLTRHAGGRVSLN